MSRPVGVDPDRWAEVCAQHPGAPVEELIELATDPDPMDGLYDLHAEMQREVRAGLLDEPTEADEGGC